MIRFNNKKNKIVKDIFHKSEAPEWLQILFMALGIALGFCIVLGFMFLAFGGYLYGDY